MPCSAKSLRKRRVPADALDVREDEGPSVHDEVSDPLGDAR